MSISLKFLLGIVLSIGTSISLGLLLGNFSVSKSKILTQNQERALQEAEESAPPRKDNTQFMASITPGSHLPSILLEAQYANEVGITKFILSTPIPSTPKENEQLVQAIDGIKNIGDDTTLTLALDCNPSQSWLRQNPDEASIIKIDGATYPSVGSQKWQAHIDSGITKLLNMLSSDIKGNRVTGVILNGLENGQWIRTGAKDASPAHEAAFSAWRSQKYLSLDPGVVSASPEAESVLSTFFSTHQEQDIIDYYEFLSQQTASHIIELASLVRTATNPKFTILASHPNVLEFSDPATGSWGMGTLHENEINGIISKPHSAHRQLGQHGYFASPIFPSIQTLTIDDTYTGIAYQQNSHSIEVPGTYIASNIMNLMTRNSILSAISGTTWVINDKVGNGALAHKPLWKEIDRLLTIRASMLASKKESSPKLAVVLDDKSASYIKDTDLFESIFESLLNTLTESGIEFTWTTLDDLLEGNIPSIPAYLFPNLYKISMGERDKIHEVLGTKQATAIWLYAPGYIDESADVANISALTGITTVQRDATTKSGSKFAFSGTWIEESQDFGAERATVPTFASMDEYADPLARYRDNEDISAAMKYHEEGWTSIVIYEPTVTSEFLRDLFYILEIPMDIAVTETGANPVVYANPMNILLHSKEDTTLNIEFDTNQDVTNTLNTRQGWNNTRTLSIELGAGETSLLSVH